MTTLFTGTIAGWESRRDVGRYVPTPADLCADLTATCLAVLTARAADTASTIEEPNVRSHR